MSSSPALLERYDGFLVDLDGTVYVGGSLLPGSREALWTVVRSGKRLLYLTNNPFTVRSELRAKLEAFGLPVEGCPIVTAAWAAAQFAARRVTGPGSEVFVLGAEALQRDCREAGLLLAGTGRSPDIEAVIIGGFFEFNYELLKQAAWAARSAPHLIATNNDPVFPTEEGPWPGTGAIVAAVETAAQRKATVVGKPEAVIFQLAAQALSLPEGARILTIGDSLGTDVAGGKRAGYDAALVLTGNSRAEQAEAAGRDGRPAPDFVSPSLGALLLSSQG